MLRKPSNLSEIRCSSVVKPWLHNPMVQGSNPIDAQKFFSFDHFKLRLSDSIDGYCEIALGDLSKRLKLQNQVN